MIINVIVGFDPSPSWDVFCFFSMDISFSWKEETLGTSKIHRQVCPLRRRSKQPVATSSSRRLSLRLPSVWVEQGPQSPRRLDVILFRVKWLTRWTAQTCIDWYRLIESHRFWSNMFCFWSANCPASFHPQILWPVAGFKAFFPLSWWFHLAII